MLRTIRDCFRILALVAFFPFLICSIPFILMVDDWRHRREKLMRDEESMGPYRPCPKCGYFNRFHFDWDREHEPRCSWVEEDADVDG
jgi:hypothetical protein